MIQGGKDSSYRFVIGALALWANLSLGLNWQVVSPILPLISDDFGISFATASLLVGLVMIIHGVLALPGGVVLGRLGLRRTYAISWFLISLPTLSALSPGFEGLLTLRILYGVGMAMMIPATGHLVMQWFRPKELPVVNSLTIAAVSIGLVVSISTAAPMSDVIGWPRTLGVFSAVGLAGAFAWLVWGRGTTEEGMAEPFAMGEIWAVLRHRTVWLMGTADAACFSMYVVMASWLPTFYHETRGMSLTEAGFITSLLPLMGIFAVVLGGLLPLKIRPRQLFFIVPGAMAGLGGLGSFLIDNTALTYASVAVMGLGCWMYLPSLVTLPMQLPGMNPQRVALAWAWFATIGGFATFVSPFAVGAIRDATGTFVPGFLVFAVLAWYLFAAGFFLPSTAPKRALSAGAEAPASLG